MKNRSLILVLMVFFGAFLMNQGCTKTQRYRMSEDGKESANLIYPSFIEVQSFDGKSVEGLLSGIIYEGKKEVVFSSGTHTVVLRYYDIWDIDDNDHEKVYSNLITLRFDAEAGNRYKIDVDVPKDRQSALKLASHFDPTIIDERTGNRVSY